MATEITTAAGALLRFRNRDIGPRELEFLRTTIARGGWRTLTDLSRIVCEAWAWRQRNGGLSAFACRDLLLRLEQWGHLDLGVRRRRGPRGSGRKKSGIPIELIPIAEIALTDAEANLNELVVRPIEREERLGWRLYMERYHYLGFRPLVGEHLLYAAYLDTELVALLGWGSAALHVPARERFVGWDEQAKRRHLHLVANNVRFLVLPWVRVKSLASKVLAYNLRRLSRDWQAVWGHPVLLAETFVDTARFRATCYRAANWNYLGHTAGRTKRGYQYLNHGTPKAVFVYELHARACQLLCTPEPER
jgi:hypothetical protein